MSDTPTLGFPDSLSDLLLRNTSEQAPDLNEFHEYIDDSDYSTEDWIEALIAFDTWLKKQKVKPRPFGLMLGYIDCCTVKNTANISLASLNIIVIQSLIEFGFDGSNSSQI